MKDENKKNQLTEDQKRIAEERFKQGLCPSCGLPIPWQCRGPLEHMRNGK